jgi:hypothetical protein
MSRRVSPYPAFHVSTSGCSESRRMSHSRRISLSAPSIPFLNQCSAMIANKAKRLICHNLRSENQVWRGHPMAGLMTATVLPTQTFSELRNNRPVDALYRRCKYDVE